MESKLVLQKSTEDSVYDFEKSIFCQKKTKTPLSWTENGRQNIIEAANKRRDEVYKRLKNSNIQKLFKHLMTNDCYKKYTLKNTLENMKVSNLYWLS